MVHTVEQFFTLIGHKGKDVWSSGKPNNQQKLLQHCFFVVQINWRYTHTRTHWHFQHTCGWTADHKRTGTSNFLTLSLTARCTQRVPLVTFSQRPIYRRRRRLLIAFSPTPHNVKLRAAMLLYDYFFFFFPQKKSIPSYTFIFPYFFLFFGKMCSWWCAVPSIFPPTTGCKWKTLIFTDWMGEKDVVTHAPIISWWQHCAVHSTP